MHSQTTQIRLSRCWVGRANKRRCGTRPTAHIAWLLASLGAALFLTGCNRVCATACETEGLCSMRTHNAGDALYRCYAASDDDCANAQVCADTGRCFATEQGVCVTADAVADAACSVSTQCSRWGRCGHREGTCWAESDDDCAASFECRTVGRCGARGGVCIPITDDHCEQSLGCEIEGLCARTTYLNLSYECRVPLDDPAACAQSWVCTHYGRCAPALPADCEGCRYGFCAEPGHPAVRACSAAAAVIPECSTDGRCAPDATYTCAHAPIGGPAPGDQLPVGDDGPPPVDEAPPPAVADPAPPRDAKPPTHERPTDSAAPAAPGPGAVAFSFPALDGRPYQGLLTHATLLTGVRGFEAQPIDMLVFRATAETGCDPRSRQFGLPLGAIWLMGAIPAGEGTFRFEGGPMPGQMAAKTWVWTGDASSGSRNLGMHGTIEVSSRTATEVRGTVELRATEYFNDSTAGTVVGPFVADVVDCADHTGGWPM